MKSTGGIPVGQYVGSASRTLVRVDSRSSDLSFCCHSPSKDPKTSWGAGVPISLSHAPCLLACMRGIFDAPDTGYWYPRVPCVSRCYTVPYDYELCRSLGSSDIAPTRPSACAWWGPAERLTGRNLRLEQQSDAARMGLGRRRNLHYCNCC